LQPSGDAPIQSNLRADDQHVVIDQKDMTFIPRVTAVQHGRPVGFDNSDSVNHSVSILSRHLENDLSVFVTAGPQ